LFSFTGSVQWRHACRAPKGHINAPGCSPEPGLQQQSAGDRRIVQRETIIDLSTRVARQIHRALLRDPTIIAVKQTLEDLRDMVEMLVAAVHSEQEFRPLRKVLWHGSRRGRQRDGDMVTFHRPFECLFWTIIAQSLALARISIGQRHTRLILHELQRELCTLSPFGFHPL
jgi:hypothetical protein